MQKNDSWLENEYPTIVKWGHKSGPLRVVLSITGKVRTGNRPEVLAYWNQTIKSIKEIHNIDLIVTGFTDDQPSYPSWNEYTPGPGGSFNSKEAEWTQDKSTNPFDDHSESKRILEVKNAIPFDHFHSEPGSKVLFPDDLEFNRSYQPIYKFLRSLDPIGNNYDVVIKARFDHIHTVDPRYDAVGIIKDYFAGNIREIINYIPGENGKVLFDRLTIKNYNYPEFSCTKDVHFNDHMFFMNRTAAQDCRDNIERVLTESYPVRIYNLAWIRSICQPDTIVSSTIENARLASHIIRPFGE